MRSYFHEGFREWMLIAVVLTVAMAFTIQAKPDRQAPDAKPNIENINGEWKDAVCTYKLTEEAGKVSILGGTFNGRGERRGNFIIIKWFFGDGRRADTICYYSNHWLDEKGDLVGLYGHTKDSELNEDDLLVSASPTAQTLKRVRPPNP